MAVLVVLMGRKPTNKFEEVQITPEKVGHKILALINLNGEYAIKVSSICFALLTKINDANKNVDEDYPDYWVCGYYNNLQGIFLKLIHEKNLTKMIKYDNIDIERYINIFQESVSEVTKLCSKFDNFTFKDD